MAEPPSGDPPTTLGDPSAPGGRWSVPAPIAVGAMAITLLLVGIATAAVPGPDQPVGRWQPALYPAAGEQPTVTPPSPTPTDPAGAITLAATGDIILGDAGRLPAGDGAGFFAGVADALAADLVMGNLEQPLTEDTGFEKCEEDSAACHAFRAPPHYGAHLRDGGFQLLNLANNHGNDFGPDGRANTRAALDQHGIAYTGERNEITVVEAAGASVAVVGFSPYAWTNDLNDLAQAQGVVSQATTRADLVVVQVHMGAEGADATRVQPGPEDYFGEQRGDPMAFARAVIDAGADLVVGHGPHVLRGLEFYQDRLIAYSLGNFAGGGGTLNADGDLGLGAVLQVTLHPGGEFAAGTLVSTHMYQAGLPTLDPEQRSLALVREVTRRDFPATGPGLGPGGELTPP